jgi:hypothetical protein
MQPKEPMPMHREADTTSARVSVVTGATGMLDQVPGRGH